MLPKIVVAALFVAIFVGLIVKSARELSDNRGRAVWWQNIDPWRWIIIACYIPITVLIAAWPAIPLGLLLLIFVLPLVMITALSIARLIGIYLSERDEVNRNRALGEPTHAYLKSTTAIILCGRTDHGSGGARGSRDDSRAKTANAHDDQRQ